MVCTRCDSCGAPPFVVFVAAALVGFVAAVEFLPGRSFFFCLWRGTGSTCCLWLAVCSPPREMLQVRLRKVQGRAESIVFCWVAVACGGGLERLAPVLRPVLLTFKSFFESRARSPRV